MLGIRSATMMGKERKECLFYPDDRAKVFFWDTFVSIILMATLFLTPFQLAFSDEMDEVDWFVALQATIDIFFFIDIFVCFNTAIAD